MKTEVKNIFYLFISFIFLISCSGFSVDSDHQEDVVLKNYKKYSFKFDNKEKFDPDSLIGQRIVKQFKTNIQKYGHEYVEDKKLADYFVEFRYFVNTYLSTPTTSVGVGVGSSSGVGFGRVSVGRTLPTRRQVQGLSIHMFDTKTNNEIWNGEARGQIKFNTAEKTNEKIKTAIELLISQFNEDLK